MTRASIMSALMLSGTLCASACSTATDPAPEVDRDARNDLAAAAADTLPRETASGEKTGRLLVHHHMAECHGLQPQLCVLVRESERDDWTFMFDGIEGFEYRWGYSYDLRIATRDVPNPPEDASSVAYRLIDTTSRTAVDIGMLFDFPSVWAPELISRDGNGRFHLGYRRQFACTPADCDTLASLLDQRLSVLLQFRHPADSSAPLELVQIPCSDVEESFRDSCLP